MFLREGLVFILDFCGILQIFLWGIFAISLFRVTLGFLQSSFLVFSEWGFLSVQVSFVRIPLFCYHLAFCCHFEQPSGTIFQKRINKILALGSSNIKRQKIWHTWYSWGDLFNASRQKFVRKCQNIGSKKPNNNK